MPTSAYREIHIPQDPRRLPQSVGTIGGHIPLLKEAQQGPERQNRSIQLVQ